MTKNNKKEGIYFTTNGRRKDYFIYYTKVNGLYHGRYIEIQGKLLNSSTWVNGICTKEHSKYINSKDSELLLHTLQATPLNFEKEFSRIIEKLEK